MLGILQKEKIKFKGGHVMENNKGKILKKGSKQSGITLVALVVTIVVLLILAGVSLNLVLNNSGIIKKSGEARDKYSDASANEQEQMQDALDWINSNANGNSSVNWDKVLADATANPDKYKHEDQSSTNGDIGIGTDGKPVNLDLWTYKVINENEITLGNNGGCGGHPGYRNANIVDGKIQGKVPQYIKISGKDEFYVVTSMYGSFGYCDKLIIAPIIPTTVTNLEWAFRECTSLTTVATIPPSVTDMNHTFDGCTSLTTVPIILEGVTNMKSTFAECTSLITAPVIPSSVTNMDYTFSGCSKLQGNIEINANPTYYTQCFYGAATEGSGLTVTGSSTLLDEIIATGSSNKITRGN